MIFQTESMCLQTATMQDFVQNTTVLLRALSAPDPWPLRESNPPHSFLPTGMGIHPKRVLKRLRVNIAGMVLFVSPAKDSGT